MEPQRQGQTGGGGREQGYLLVTGQQLIGLCPRHHLEVRVVSVPGDPSVCPILSGDELWLIPIWVSRLRR